jgi:hypothetical protein
VVRTLVETQALVGERGRYRLTKQVQTLQMPSTVQQDSGVHFLISTSRIRAAFGRELASAPCRPAAAF